NYPDPMARQKNNVDTVQITLSVTQSVRDFLEQLSISGFYGKNAAETAAVLLKEKLRELSTRRDMVGVAPGPTPTRPTEADTDF
ncbi:MAG: hypothetical protein ACK5CW_13560, partial [Verrucomicrobiota bacterium]